MTATLRLTLAIATAFGLAACDRDEKLPGQRLDPLAVTSPDGPGYEGAAGITGTALSLPGISGNSEWTQRAGNAAHAPVHAAIGQGTNRIWSAPIGQAQSKRHRITADPVVAGGLVFTLDAQARVTATSVGGGRAWSTDITPVQENPASASGGGLAYEGGRIFATTASANWSRWTPPAARCCGASAWTTPSAADPPSATAWSMSPRAAAWAGPCAPATVA